LRVNKKENIFIFYRKYTGIIIEATIVHFCFLVISGLKLAVQDQSALTISLMDFTSKQEKGFWAKKVINFEIILIVLLEITYGNDGQQYRNAFTAFCKIWYGV
jgi:hypothetical protein